MDAREKQAISAMRILAVEAVDKANSGHPGLPLGASPMVYELWSKHMSHNPKNPNFFNRDRFVLSAGHGSALLYSALHLFGYGLTKEDLMGFRQLKSKTPGHPEHGVTAGVEVSTGPLGQGFANAVGFATAEKMLASKYNKEDCAIVDHYTYVLCGDGCMQEGISYEAASFAGTMELNKLICFYDSNGITIEGSTDITFKENVGARFEAQGWNVLYVNDGEDISAIGEAIEKAKTETVKPSLIVVKTIIGYGSPKAGTGDVHGSPLGAAGIEATKKNLGYEAEAFSVPADTAKYYGEIIDGLANNEVEWNKVADSYKAKYPQEYAQFMAEINNEVADIKADKSLYDWAQKPVSTRNACEMMLNKLSSYIPSLVGGSADLAPSNKTWMKGVGELSSSDATGRNIHFGIREHSMGAICNGIALHGGFLPYCATFLSFSDYMKNAIRMSALMGLNVTYLFSHDSIGVGEDGPTHQPVEQILTLRSIPNNKVFRPADGIEMTASFASAINGEGTTCIITSRQDLAYTGLTDGDKTLQGGYILMDSKNATPEVILMASGSEVGLIVDSAKELVAQGIDTRVVSMPCMELFEKQTAEYKESVLPKATRARVAVEAASSLSWHRYVGLDGACITMDKFGDSAPADLLFEMFGFTKDNVVAVAKSVAGK